MKANIILYIAAIAFYQILLCSVFTKPAQAQVIYTDIPDATPSASFSLDLNNDNIEDYLIQFASADKVMCIPQNSNAYCGEFAGSTHLPWALSSFANICDTLPTWYDASSPGTMAWGSSTGHWAGAADKYLALKLIVGPNTYYGWARLDFTATASSFTIKDYAHESTPNKCIQAGQTNLAIYSTLPEPKIFVFPNPCSASATIQISGSCKKPSITMYNCYGQVVQYINDLTQQKVSISRATLSNGVYLISLKDEGLIIALTQLVLSD
jgi:hypothetical protein